MSKNTSSSVYVQPQKILLLSNSLMVTHMENIRMYSYYTTTLPMESTKLQTLGTKINMKVLDHVMPREKRCGALDSCFRRWHHNFTLRHHEFIKATRSTALVVLN